MGVLPFSLSSLNAPSPTQNRTSNPLTNSAAHTILTTNHTLVPRPEGLYHAGIAHERIGSCPVYLQLRRVCQKVHTVSPQDRSSVVAIGSASIRPRFPVSSQSVEWAPEPDACAASAAGAGATPKAIAVRADDRHRDETAAQ
jgi:hypothetical protein